MICHSNLIEKLVKRTTIPFRLQDKDVLATIQHKDKTSIGKKSKRENLGGDPKTKNIGSRKTLLRKGNEVKQENRLMKKRNEKREKKKEQVK